MQTPWWGCRGGQHWQLPHTPDLHRTQQLTHTPPNWRLQEWRQGSRASHQDVCEMRAQGTLAFQRFDHGEDGQGAH